MTQLTLTGATFNGAEIGNFDYSAGRYVLSSAGELDFRPGKTLYFSVDFSATALHNSAQLAIL